MKIAGYVRVSTAEQRINGFSLDAQRALIEKYAEQNGHHLVGIYADEGKSASKQLHKRKGLLKMLDDAEAGMFDCIAFKDLTRWSRNPSQFYAVQERLDAAKVGWIAIEQPNLETVTATGRLMVGITISVAAHESAQTSERIKFVNANRIKDGGVLYGRYPFGYKVGMVDGQKRVVINEDEREMVEAMFDLYERTGKPVSVVNLCRDVYGRKTEIKTVLRMFRNTLYKGEYKGVKNYCPAFLTEERWAKIKRITEQRNYTPPIPKNVYIFSSLVKCAECGHSMIGRTFKEGRYIYYGCDEAILHHGCIHMKRIREDAIEKYLVETIDATLAQFEVEVQEQTKKAANPAPIRAKLARLKNLYIDGDLSKDEYEQRRDKLNAELAAIPPVDVLQRAKRAFPSGWYNYYKEAPKEAKRMAWRSVLDRIEVDSENRIKAFFV